MIHQQTNPTILKNLVWVLAKTFKCVGIKVFNQEEEF